jgi:hypothetical protein
MTVSRSTSAAVLIAASFILAGCLPHVMHENCTVSARHLS